ncbi:hypothetical protein LPY66_03950 [Dehalobacter sp. DCM]|uniref:hypothetical protein n=1 Tax=Dehalobacter sp. DCM TaxID=2907827 RepID=UPI0030820C5D|nr:hypothetical protein LPY66_03950 [Dehalobacter sp. DCM]
MKESVERFSNNIKTQLVDFTEHLLAKVKENEETNLKKDADIENLSNQLAQALQENKELKNIIASQDFELDRQRQIADLSTSDSQLIIIYQPQDIFSYPRHIIRWYFNEVDFSRLSFEDLSAAIKGLLEFGDCETIDEIIYYICDSCLDKLKPAEVPVLLDIIRDYLDMQYKKQYYSPSGIYYFLNSLHIKNWTSLLKENGFVQHSMGILEDLIFRIEDFSFTIKEPLTLLKVYIDLTLNDEAKMWLKRILTYMVPEAETDSKTQLEFLYIGFCYQLDQQVLEFFPELNETTADNHLSELKAYMAYQKAVNRQMNIQQALDTIQSLRDEPPVIEKSLRKKVYDQMLEKLKFKFLTEINLPQQENQKDESQTLFDMYELDSLDLVFPKQDPSQENTVDGCYTDKWNEESDLKKLGYRTSLSSSERWDVLVHRALPKLGYQRVCQYLKWFIEQKSRIKQKDFSHAIAIWQLDLNKLNKYIIEHNKIKDRL